MKSKEWFFENIKINLNTNRVGCYGVYTSYLNKEIVLFNCKMCPFNSQRSGGECIKTVLTEYKMYTMKKKLDAWSNL